jgi:hypothetical protein
MKTRLLSRQGQPRDIALRPTPLSAFYVQECGGSTLLGTGPLRERAMDEGRTKVHPYAFDRSRHL